MKPLARLKNQLGKEMRRWKGEKSCQQFGMSYDRFRPKIEDKQAPPARQGASQSAGRSWAIQLRFQHTASQPACQIARQLRLTHPFDI